MNYAFTIRSISDEDKPGIVKFVTENWGSPIVISRRKEYPVELLDGFVAIQDNAWVGLITLCIENMGCQIITLDAEIENIGIGTELLNQAIEYALRNNCKRV